jgi:hypothetical protein
VNTADSTTPIRRVIASITTTVCRVIGMVSRGQSIQRSVAAPQSRPAARIERIHGISEHLRPHRSPRPNLLEVGHHVG